MMSYFTSNNCRPFQSWQGSSQPRKAVHMSVPKLVPACSSGQLRRCHQSYGSCYRQSNIESQVRKNSTTHAAASEPGDVYYANEDEEKIAYLAPSVPYAYYNVQSPQDNAVKLNHRDKLSKVTTPVLIPEKRAHRTTFNLSQDPARRQDEACQEDPHGGGH